MAQFTGYQINRGYAEYAVADERFCFPIPAKSRFKLKLNVFLFKYQIARVK